ncbi:ABC transporter substrate-binding protein [Rhodococcus marinonascens]|uniref:ABC transporter substrate-binding protein n=1 Tax=Rhodococcus marinonascens TaxID=38311 RepID=UPI000934E835|nr:ABC transporter substrate-binding protein [Rhodococcus marinonascens]
MKKLVGALTAVAVMGVAACGSSTGADDSGAIKIGSVHPTTGALAGVGGLMNDGAAMAVADINAAGGISSLGGRQLELVSGDSQGRAEVGQSEAQRLISDGAVALVGTYQSDVTQNVTSVAERSRVPFVIDVAVDDQILDQGYQYTFRVQPDASRVGTDGAQALAAIARQTGQAIDRVSYLHIEGSFGDSVFEAFEAEAGKQGISVQELIYPATNFSDATTLVREAAVSNPDIIASTGYYPDGLLIARAVEQLNVDVMGVYGIASGAFDDSSFPSDAGAAGEGVLSANYHFDATSERVNDIRARFLEQYGRPMETAAMLSYQAVEVIAAGLEDGADANPEALRNSIAGVSMQDPLLAFDGPIEFDETGQNKNATAIVMQVRDGAVAQVFPEQFATDAIDFPVGTGQ